MKKTILLFSVFVAILESANSQTWNTAGNTGTFPITDFVGTTDTKDLSFRTDNTIKMQLKTTGELGIGTTTPNAWLQLNVVGAVDAIRTYTTSTNDAHWKMFRNNTEYGRLSNYGGTTSFTLQAMRGDLRLAAGSSGTLIQSIQAIGGIGSNAGNVGIGDYTTFTPNTLLHIHKKDSNNVDLQLTNASSGFATTSNGILLRLDNANKCTFYNYEDNDIEFGTANVGAGGSATARMLIRGGTNDGKIGISNPSPFAMLDIISKQTNRTGENRGFNVDEVSMEDTSTSTARSVGAYVTAKNGIATLGVISVVDNKTSNTGVVMQSFYSRCRNTNPTNVTEAYNYYALNETACKASLKFGFGAFMSGTGSNNSYGAYLSSTSTDGNNYGLFAVASGATGDNYGVYTSTPTGTCTTGTSCSDAALFVNGDAFQISTGTYYSSDISLKKNILPFQNAKNILAN